MASASTGGAKTLERHAHDDRDRRNGRYRKTPKCDGCGRPIGTNYFTDDEVCGGTDGPGFFVCDRKSCVKNLEGKTVKERAKIYRAMRSKTEAKR